MWLLHFRGGRNVSCTVLCVVSRTTRLGLVQGDAQTKNSWAYLEASAQRIDLENDYNVTFASDSDQV